MRTYFKIKAVFDPESISDLTYLEQEQLFQIYSKFEEGIPEVTLLCSLDEDGELEVHNLDDRPIVSNQVIELYDGVVTIESKFQ